MIHNDYANVWMSENPLTQHYLSLLRDIKTPTGRFRSHVISMTRVLFFEAMSELEVPVAQMKFDTAHGENSSTGAYVDSKNYALIAVMRTGTVMTGAVQDLLEDAVVGHALFKRGEDGNELKSDWIKFPDLTDKFVFVFDSGLLSGSTVMGILRHLIAESEVHPSRIAVITCIATHQAVQAINSVFDPNEHPVRIFTSAIDDWTEGNSYADPGVGSFRERLYGKDVQESDDGI